jgi:hypothetical protein
MPIRAQQPPLVPEPTRLARSVEPVWFVPAVGLVSVVILGVWPSPASWLPAAEDPHGVRLRLLFKPPFIPLLTLLPFVPLALVPVLPVFVIEPD